MMGQGKQFITGLDSDMVSGISDKVDEIAESQARTDSRVDHLASGASEVKESLAAASGFAKAQEQRFTDRINELQAMIEGLCRRYRALGCSVIERQHAQGCGWRGAQANSAMQASTSCSRSLSNPSPSTTFV